MSIKHRLIFAWRTACALLVFAGLMVAWLGVCFAYGNARAGLFVSNAIEGI